MANEGKKFEEDFRKSIPAGCYIYKLKDAGGWSNASNTRFTISNMCDFIMYYKPTLYLLELKSTKGKSLPFSNIKDNQIKELLVASNTEGVRAGLVINLRSINETYYLNIKDFKKYVETTERKSISLDYLRSKGILIEQELKKTRYRYNIKEFIKKA